MIISLHCDPANHPLFLRPKRGNYFSYTHSSLAPVLKVLRIFSFPFLSELLLKHWLNLLCNNLAVYGHLRIKSIIVLFPGWWYILVHPTGIKAIWHLRHQAPSSVYPLFHKRWYYCKMRSARPGGLFVWEHTVSFCGRSHNNQINAYNLRTNKIGHTEWVRNAHKPY